MYDLGMNALAVRAKRGDSVGKETGFYELQAVTGAVAALYQQLIVGAPRDNRNTAVPGQQRLVWLKCVLSLCPAGIGNPSTRAIVRKQS
jgi:hypothetical protein